MNQSSLHSHFPLIKSSSKRVRSEDEDPFGKCLKPEINPQAIKLKSLITPIPSIPGLPTNISEVMHLLKPSKPSVSVEEILTSLPAKEKYSELLDPLHGFPLPYPYKKLVNLLDSLDKTLNFCSMVNQPPTLEFVSSFMSEKYKQVFCFDMFSQISALVPDFKLALTEKIPKEHVLQIHEEEMTQESRTRRKGKLIKALMGLAMETHDSFCKKLGVETPRNAWHPEFDLNSVPVVVSQDKEKDRVKSIVMAEVSPRNKSVGAVFMDMENNGESDGQVTMSERRLAQDFEELDYNWKRNQAEIKKECEKMSRLCEAIRILFTSLKTPSIFFVNLCRKMIVSGFEENVEKNVMYICLLFPSWLSVIQTNSGKVIRQNRSSSLTLKSMIEEIHKSYNYNYE